MTYLLAVDPSIVSPGVALFCEGKLVANARVKVCPQPEACAAQRCCNAIAELCTWYGTTARLVDTLAFEYPQIYAHDTPAVANAVVSMAAVGMGLSYALDINDTHSYTPREIWGQLPKAKTGSYWKCPRGARVWSRLDADERTVAVDQHDAGDAVGIGLFHLGRFAAKRVLTSS